MTSVLWRMRSEPSLEHCQLSEESAAIKLEGTVVARWESALLSVRYRLRCSRDWKTHHAFVEVLRDSGVSTLELTVDSQQRWWRAGHELPEFRGLTDIDLQVSPCTNTLPIRRLNLALGESANVTAVWVRFPGLELERLDQQYTRVGPHSYRYESGQGSFRAELDVDQDGLVVRYGDLWERA